MLAASNRSVGLCYALGIIGVVALVGGYLAKRFLRARKRRDEYLYPHRRLVQIASQIFFVLSIILLIVLFALIIAAYTVLRQYAPKPRHRNVLPGQSYSLISLRYLMHLLELD